MRRMNAVRLRSTSISGVPVLIASLFRCEMISRALGPYGRNSLGGRRKTLLSAFEIVPVHSLCFLAGGECIRVMPLLS